MNKPKKTQPKTPDTFQPRDGFQTPAYAVDLLTPFIAAVHEHWGYISHANFRIWECAAGDGFITKALRGYGYDVVESDIRERPGCRPLNFLTDEPLFCGLIVTNPPYSLKDVFIARAIELNLPFMFLIPGDYAKKTTINPVRFQGAKKIVPDSRINYLTPNLPWLVEKGELFRCHPEYFSTNEKKDITEAEWMEVCEKHGKPYRYASAWGIPDKLCARYSASQFNSIWLARLPIWPKDIRDGQTEVFVDIPAGAKSTRVIPV